MMKGLRYLLVACVLWLVGVAAVSAFDTDKRAPVWNLTNTFKFLEDVTPGFACGESTAEEMLELLRYQRPPKFSPEMVVDEALLVSGAKFNMEVRDQSMRDILLVVAERLKADVVVRPGRIELVPRKVK